MADSKKYWYIQLNVNFFEDERIDWLCEQQNGYAYVVLYLKLCLKTANNNGILTRQIGDMIIPYNIDKIAETTHMNVDIVRVALELYKRIGLIYEADENCNFMRLPEVPQMVGCITQAAIDKRKQRDRKKLLPEPDNLLDNVQDNVQDNVPQELRDKSIKLRVKSIELRDNSLEKDNKRSAQNKRFVPPAVDEVRAYCKERGNNIDAESFVDYYTSTGWLVGKKPMKDWKASVRTWERNERRQDNARPDTTATGNTKREWHLECAVDGTKDCNREPSTGQVDWPELS